MHEIGALHEMVVEAETIAKKNNVSRIRALEIELGELSGMLPEFFEKYYSIVIENRPLFKDSELKIKIVKGQGLCLSCSAFYNVAANKGFCPKCGSRNKKIISGTDLVLKNIDAIIDDGEDDNEEC